MKKNKSAFSKIKVRLNVTDFNCDAAEISKILKLNPSKTWRKGEAICGTIRTYQENGWRFEIPEKITPVLQNRIALLLQKIRMRRKAFEKLPSGTEVELSCVIYSYNGHQPVIGFDKKTVLQLAEIKATIDVDLYAL